MQKLVLFHCIAIDIHLTEDCDGKKMVNNKTWKLYEVYLTEIKTTVLYCTYIISFCLPGNVSYSCMYL